MQALDAAAGLARRTALAGVGLAALLAGGMGPAAAAPIYAYQQTLAVPPSASNTAGIFTNNDLSTFDASNQLYYLTDRSNNGIDVFSAATISYVTRIGAGLFAGTQGGNDDISGPNGIMLANVGTGKLLVVGNGPSTLLAFNLDSTGVNVVGAPRTISTAVAGTPVPPNRVDGVAYAPGANTILAANNASTPGFLTLVSNATGQVVRSIPLNGTGGYPDVGGNGVESTIYNTVRGAYLIAVPALNSGGTGAGGVIELDAATGNLLHTYDFNALGLAGACSPTGLVQGGGAAMFVVCSDPTAAGSLLFDPTGNGSVTVVPGIRGGDQAAYDPTRNVFFEAARFQPGGSVLGVVDAATLALQLLPTGAGDHAVAVDPVSGKVFVASGPTEVFANCSAGCIGVFAPQQAVPEPATLPVLASVLAGVGLFRLRRQR